jgi:hypothetical protein
MPRTRAITNEKQNTGTASIPHIVWWIIKPYKTTRNEMRAMPIKTTMIVSLVFGFIASAFLFSQQKYGFILK